MSERRTTIIVPAHNEEGVIARTLSTVLEDATPAEFDLVVVCNGCRDRTADVVRRRFATARVIELGEASKSAAINAGLQTTVGSNVLLLDADVQISTHAARALTVALRTPGIEAAIGHMNVDDESSSWPVRAFYRVWKRSSYLRNGKFAAAFALSASAVERIGQLPPIIADDTYLRRHFSTNSIAVVDAVSFRASAPRTLAALIRVRSRVHRGNRELDKLLPDSSRSATHPVRDHIREILRRPPLWVDLPWYLAVQVAARIMSRTGNQSWGQDLTSRQAMDQR